MEDIQYMKDLNITLSQEKLKNWMCSAYTEDIQHVRFFKDSSNPGKKSWYGKSDLFYEGKGKSEQTHTNF